MTGSAWIWMSLGSAFLLSLYDVAKKQSMNRNGAIHVLLFATAISSILLCPFLGKGSLQDHMWLIFKAFIVSASWISGMVALRTLPLTTVSTVKASRPFLVVLFSIIIFGERLNLWQWGGVALALAAVLMLSFAGKQKREPAPEQTKGLIALAISIITGVASAIYDKQLLSSFEPLFLQSWSNVYITVVMALALGADSLFGKERKEPKFKWDWTILLIAILITLSDGLYFFAIKADGALLSVISLIRRSSLVFTFLIGVMFFGEKNVSRKAVAMAVMIAGMVCLLLGSS